MTCVGIAVQDVVYALPAFPAGPGKYHASSRLEVGGGVAANAAVAISHLGGDSRYIGPLGDDQLGNTIVNDLASEGVEVAKVRRVSGIASPQSSVIVVPGGERLIVNHSDPLLFDTAQPPDASDLDGSDAILVDVRWRSGAESALRWAKRHGVPGVLDCDIGNDRSDDLIGLASHVVFSAAALRQHTGENGLEDGLRAVSDTTPAWLGVTDGENGTLWIENGLAKRFPSFQVTVVDTTGAGDVYHGALALALTQEDSTLDDVIELASAAAALTCMKLGGRNGIPAHDDVRSFLAAQA